MTRQELIKRQNEAVKNMEALSQKVANEKRLMTAEEKRQFKAFELEASESKQLIAKMDKKIEAEQKANAASIKNLKPDSKESKA